MSETATTNTTTLKNRGRIVAIIGRPNVGKSALFNRIAGQRLAIVHDESGVTRDRMMREVNWLDDRFTLIDTGGVNITHAGQAADTITAGTRQQVDAAMEDAAVAILVTDVQSGITPMDEEVAAIIRRSGLPCLLAVNKVDQPLHETAAAEFARLGLPLFTISAAHGRGVSELMERVVELLPPPLADSTIKPLRVAVVGRPNIGKSSYINRLLESERVIVSDIPGTTRDSIEIPFTIGAGEQVRHYVLIDTAGMRRVHAVDNAVERFSIFRAEKTIESADIVVLMVDATMGPTLQDKKIAAKIIEARKGCLLIMNKWDIPHADGITETEMHPAFFREMGFMAYCPLVFMSAKNGYNVRQSIDKIDEIASQLQTKLPTGILNRVIEEACSKIHMPAAGRKRLKIFYATQTGTAPIRLRLFVNDTKLVKKSLIDYLERRLREHFGLDGTPVVMAFRERPRTTKPSKTGN